MNKFLLSCIIFLLVVLCVIELYISNNNRYQIYMHSTYRADQYLLDTRTGKVWHVVEDPHNKLLIWEPMLKSNPTLEELIREPEQNK